MASVSSWSPSASSCRRTTSCWRTRSITRPLGGTRWRPRSRGGLGWQVGRHGRADWRAPDERADQHGRFEVVSGFFIYASAALVLALALTLFVGRAAFARRIAREVDRMFAAAEGDPRVVSEVDLVGLPQPVQRWLWASNVVGSACPVTVRLTQQ